MDVNVIFPCNEDEYSIWAGILTLLNLNFSVAYESWINNVRSNLLEKRVNFPELSDYEFARKLRLHLRIKSCDDFVNYVMSQDRFTEFDFTNDHCTRLKSFAILLIEQSDVNRYTSKYHNTYRFNKVLLC